MGTKEMFETDDFEYSEWGSAYDLEELSDTDIVSVDIRAWRRFFISITLLAGGFIAGFVLLISSRISFSQNQDQSSAASVGNGSQVLSVEFLDAELDNSNPSTDNQSFEYECQVSIRYPNKVRRWCGLITEYSDRRGLPPDLVAAVILQESGGDPEAFSHSGAVGLMQVMPRDGLASTFMCTNGPCFANRPSKGELRDPEFNVSYGTRMLASLVRKHGSLREALKSYGPMDGGYSYADKVLGIYQLHGS